MWGKLKYLPQRPHYRNVSESKNHSAIDEKIVDLLAIPAHRLPSFPPPHHPTHCRAKRSKGTERHQYRSSLCSYSTKARKGSDTSSKQHSQHAVSLSNNSIPPTVALTIHNPQPQHQERDPEHAARPDPLKSGITRKTRSPSSLPPRSTHPTSNPPETSPSSPPPLLPSLTTSPHPPLPIHHPPPLRSSLSFPSPSSDPSSDTPPALAPPSVRSYRSLQHRALDSWSPFQGPV